MATYTLSQALGNRLLRQRTGVETMFALSCDGTDGVSYTTAVEPPGVNDIMANSITGTLTTTGTWTRRAAVKRPNSNTSLEVPTTASASIRNTSASNLFSAMDGTMGMWIYLTSLPTTDWFMISVGTGSTLPATPTTPTIAWSVTLQANTGKLIVDHKSGTVNQITSTATVPTGQWVYISFAAKWDRLFIGIDGVVESFHVPTKNIASGASSGHFFLIGGPNCPAGTYVDDIYCSMIPWSYDQDFTPPAYEWETEAVLSTRILVTSDIQTINYSDYVNAGRGGGLASRLL